MSGNALVFGGGGALGSAICSALAADGFTVFKAGERAGDPEGRHLQLSYSAQLSPELFGALPPMDAVVWAQGLNCSDTITTLAITDLERLLQGNVLFVAASLTGLLNAGIVASGSRLVVVSSIWQLESRPGKFSYTVSKAALQGLIKSCCLDLGPQGILINAVLPGVVDTPMTRTHLSDAQISAIEAQTALKRLAEPRDIAAAVSFLVNPSNRVITGQFLTVDGGFIGLKHA